jgi:hypothetical protein
METVFTGEAEEARLKADEASVVFGDSGCKIVVGDLAGQATERGEGVDMTSHKRFETLAVRELQIEHAAMGVHEGESVEFSQVARIIERAEVAPIHLEPFARRSSGCAKCARGEGHPLWVLNVGYPGGKTRQVSLRPEQVPQVRQALDRYRETKQTLEAICELNQFLLGLDREESKDRER